MKLCCTADVILNHSGTKLIVMHCRQTSYQKRFTTSSTGTTQVGIKNNNCVTFFYRHILYPWQYSYLCKSHKIDCAYILHCVIPVFVMWFYLCTLLRAREILWSKANVYLTLKASRVAKYSSIPCFRPSAVQWSEVWQALM